MSEIIVGECRETMRRLIADGVKVQMCVTSPPYWGLRDYGGCDCATKRYFDSQGDGTAGAMNYRAKDPRNDCPKCNGTGRLIGTERQLGLEPTPQEYVANMVEVFALVRDLLADDGTLWLNLGDSYTSGGRTAFARPDQLGGSLQETSRAWGDKDQSKIRADTPPGLKPKDLVGIPWRVAFALQADGWYLRQDIIWAKPNPMPESVRDRCTNAHEYLFLLAKSERYLCDMDAIAEQMAESSIPRMAYPRHGDNNKGSSGQYAVTTKEFSESEKLGIRNKRSVWTVTTAPYAEAHFATFPPKLIEPCILAGSRPGDTVFDPFMGSGTTAKVATSLGRQYLGCELNPAYVKLSDDRSKVTMGLAL